ncbi:MAG: hypothetical protein WCT49_04600 [Candidatus Paceibacterota bacterium]|jgi:peptidoglycan hydrolase CwlO-like protein|nr:hypothetical protein [Candidatus Paceibacterota bacterium]
MKKITATTKKPTTKKESHTEEIKRYIGALSEEFQHRVSAIGEQFSSLHEKLDEHGKKLDEHGKKLDEHKRILDMHTEMIGEMSVDIQEIKDILDEKADKKSVILLEKRLLRVEEMQKA